MARDASVSETARLIPVNDKAQLWCLDSGGAGPAVILMHPHSGNGRSFGAQFGTFVAAGYRVISYSRRAYAGSIAGDLDCPGSYVGDLLTLMDRLGVKRAAVVGIAAGGGVAMDAVLSCPDRITHAIVSSSLFGLERVSMDGSVGQALADLRPKGFDALPRDVQELGPSFRYGHPDAVAAWSRIGDLNTPPVGIKRQAVQTPVTPDALARISTPCLIMTGGADLFLPPPAARDIAAMIPGAGCVVLPDIGHAPHVESPDRFNEIALDFLLRPPASSTPHSTFTGSSSAVSPTSASPSSASKGATS